ncbi:MAG: hypothetical protein GX916_05515 [Clostridiales bacterium]|jgi:signal transduction histidine kinase|nr:hypothetical protein [Clostridiales bacterium]
MRRLLRRSYWLGNSLAMLLVILFVLLTAWTDLENDRNSLKAVLQTASAWTLEATSNLQSLADTIADSASPMRVTFLMPNGIILADSGENEQDGQAMLRRKEVVDALGGGIGERLGYENTIFQPSLYAATLLSGRLILHLSYPINEVENLIKVYIPGMAALYLLLNLISHTVLYPATGKLVRQLEQVGALLEGTVERQQIDPASYFPEIRPAMENINYLIDRMRYDLSEIRKSRDMQREFVDNTSHELKSPLTSIVGFAEMLDEMPDMPEEKKKEYLGYILRESQRMIAVINDLLMLEQAQRPTQEEMADVDLRRTADEVTASLKPQADEKNIRVFVTGAMVVRAVEQDMWELLRNLMSNAIRYGVQDGWVRVSMKDNVLTVQDNGIGIEEEHQARIFEKFYRADKAYSRSIGGTGLGLSIVANITHKYGASIHVDSAPGEGSCFTVTFVRNV